MSWISTNNLRRFADKLFHGNLSFGGSVTHNGATTFNGGVKVNTTKAEFAAPVSFTGTTTYKGNEIATKADVSAVGSNITVDGVLSATSTNPVQNKVIKTELDKKAPLNAVPTKVSQLTNDSNYATNTELANGLTTASLTVSGETNVPTPSTTNKSKTIANTEFVHGVVGDLVNGAPAALDTLQELATALGNDPNFSTTILNKIGEKESRADAQIEYERLQNAIPTKTSQLTNDANFMKSSQLVDSQPSFSGIQILSVKDDGVSEVGEHIDMHQKGTNEDYTVRLSCTGGSLNIQTKTGHLVINGSELWIG